MNQIKIAITGNMGTGKSTVTKIIKEIEKNTHVSSYSSVIKKILTILGLPITREIMQATGDFFRFYDKHVWTNILLNDIEKIKDPIIIEGVRFDFEAERLVSYGFKIIKVTSHEYLRKKRIEQREKIIIEDEKWSNWNKHNTEIFIEQIKADFIINNNGTIESLRDSIITILTNLKQNS